MKKTIYLVSIFLFVVSLVGCKLLDSFGHDYEKQYSYDDYYHFRECSDEDCQKVIDKEKHDFGPWYVKEKPNINTDGKKARDCKVCFYSQIENMTEDDLDLHVFRSSYSYDSFGHWHTCINCDFAKDEIIPHTFEIISSIEGNCCQLGITKYQCSICKYQYQTEEYGDHELKVIKEVLPSCTTYGNLTYYQCVQCNKLFDSSDASTEITKDSVILNPTGHTYNDYLSYDDGYHWFSANCGHSDVIGIERHVITFVRNESQPTCENVGYDLYHCMDCGYEFLKEIAKLEHDFILEETIPPTCTSDGHTKYGCSRCDEKLITPIPKTGHNVTTVPALEPTCGSDGNILYYECSCGTLFSDIEGENIITIDDVIIPKLPHPYDSDWSYDSLTHYHHTTCEHDVLIEQDEHDFEEWIIDKSPTCKEDGSMHRMCHTCGYVENQIIEKTGVVLTLVPEVLPTCVKDGNIRYYICTCGDIFTDSEGLNLITYEDTIIQSLGGHDYDSNGDCKNCDDFVSYKLEFTLNYKQTSYIVTGIGSCYSSEVRIPETYQGLPVSSIQEGLFSQNRTIKKLYIPPSIQTIPQFCGYDCNIEELVIGCNADLYKHSSMPSFYSCKNLKKVTFLEGVSYFKGRFFLDCQVEEIIVPDSLKTLDICFNDTLKYNIYENCKYFGNETNPYVMVMNVLNNNSTNGIIHPDAKSINIGAFKDALNITDIKVPNEVGIINNYVFEGCNSLQTITLPDDIKIIGENAFKYCYSLKAIKLPSKLTTIMTGAFYGCSSITTLEVPSYVSSIGSYAFYGMSCLKTVTLPDSVFELQSYVFAFCSSLTNIDFCSKITKIYSHAFAYCTGLKHVKIPKNVWYFEDNLFNGASIQILEFNSKMTTIDETLLGNANIYSMVITLSQTSVSHTIIDDCSVVYFYGKKTEDNLGYTGKTIILYYSEERPAFYSSLCWRYVNGVPKQYS